MTLTIAWVRSVNTVQELVVASDSRLRSIGYKDCCQKIFPLPRRDACIAFAGDTALALPIISQVIQSVENYKDARDRSQDITDSIAHVLDLVNQIQGSHRDGIEEDQLDERLATRFLYGGYSWKRARFCVFQIYYAKDIDRFVSRSLSWRRPVVAIGNKEPKAKFLEALHREIPDPDVGYNYEPMRILNDLCRNASPGDSIGGIPQMVKIYRNGNFLPFGVRRRVGNQRHVALFGRPLLDYEKTHYPIIDPKSLKTSYPLRSVKN